MIKLSDSRCLPFFRCKKSSFPHATDLDKHSAKGREIFYCLEGLT